MNSKLRTALAAIAAALLIAAAVYLIYTYTDPPSFDTDRPPPDAQPAQGKTTRPPAATMPEADTRQADVRSPPPAAADLTESPPTPGRQPAGSLQASGPIAGILRSPAADRFAAHEPGRIFAVAERPVSTFSVDVDTASYTYARMRLRHGQLPGPASVRIEEFVNYFDYGYEPPASEEAGFLADVEAFPTPWNPDTTLLRIGLKAWEEPAAERRPLRLVFLIDVSGSMQAPDKLPLLVQSLKLLPAWLPETDEVALVTYAGREAVVLELTHLSDRRRLAEALDSLTAGGGTHGAAGLREAYRIAALPPLEGSGADLRRRVLLATDGDFNIGITDPDTLTEFLDAHADDGIFLNVLGFGQGNLDDALMQDLAQRGGGVAAYVDTFHEARKLFQTDIHRTLSTVARDVKAQVEFNPAHVTDYRLLGYGSRLMSREDFENLEADAAETGSGHEVTVLYEITIDGQAARLGTRRYQDAGGGVHVPEKVADELAYLKVRWRSPDRAGTPRQMTAAVGRGALTDQPGAASRLAAAAALLAAHLADHPTARGTDLDVARRLAQGTPEGDGPEARAELTELIAAAAALLDFPAGRGEPQPR